MNSKEFILQYVDALKNGPKTRDKIDKYISDEDQELKNHIEVFEMSFPGYQLVPEDIISEGEKVAVRFTFVGLHKGKFMDFDPTGKEVRVSGMIVYQVRDDKIVNHWMVVNMAELIQQLQVESAATV